MNILIIGNGFDLAHGLPTRYIDFIEFVKYFKYLYDPQYDRERIRDIENFKKLDKNIQAYLLDEVKINNNKKEIKELNEIISQNIWIKYLIKCVDEKKLKGENWVDFEAEITDVIKSLEYFIEKEIKQNINIREDVYLVDRLRRVFSIKREGLKPLTIENMKKQINLLINDLSQLIRSLEIYLGEIIEHMHTPENDMIKALDVEKILSFNYTHTYRDLYDYEQIKAEYDYVHGKVDMLRNIDDNNMVLGINEYLKDDEKNNKIDFIEFKKYFQRIYKKTGCKYKKWVENIKDNKRETHYIYIFGHSLDVTDKEVLEDLILQDNVVTTIFYYDNYAYKQYIANLVKMIGQDILIKKVYGVNPKIIFHKQDDHFVQPKYVDTTFQLLDNM